VPPAYTLSSRVEDGLLLLDIEGTFASADVTALVGEIYHLAATLRPTAMLVDQTRYRGRPGLGTVYFASRMHPSPLPSIPVAVVEDARHQALAEFHETTVQNSGINLRSFFVRADAIAWLRSAAQARGDRA
jgi:hypothetical protein